MSEDRLYVMNVLDCIIPKVHLIGIWHVKSHQRCMKRAKEIRWKAAIVVLKGEVCACIVA